MLFLAVFTALHLLRTKQRRRVGNATLDFASPGLGLGSSDALLRSEDRVVTRQVNKPPTDWQVFETAGSPGDLEAEGYVIA